MFVIFYIFFLLFLFEIILRFRKLRYAPLKFRFLYCFFLLNKNLFIENYILSQRVHRSGLKNLNELMIHYSKISDLDLKDVIKKFIPSYNLSSGIFGFVSEIKDKKTLNKTLPLQKLKTMNINNKGFRETVNVKNLKNKKEKKIIFLGGSVMFGLGASSDEKTIPSLVSKHLNQMENSKYFFQCHNFGSLGMNYKQELQTLKYIDKNYDIIISLTGYNEIETKFFKSKKSEMYDRSVFFDFLKNFLILKAIKRFLVAFNYFNKKYSDINPSLDKSDIYPLY